MIILSPTAQIKNLQLTSGQGGDRLCGDLTLSFELAKPIPSLRVNLQVKVRFGEVPSLRMAGSRGRTVNETYSIDDVTTLDGSSNAEGYSTVKVNLSSRLPDLVAEFDRYRLEALLDVNGMEGRLFSPLTASILRDCKFFVHVPYSKPVGHIYILTSTKGSWACV